MTGEWGKKKITKIKIIWKEIDRLTEIILTWVQSGEMGVMKGWTGGKIGV